MPKHGIRSTLSICVLVGISLVVSATSFAVTPRSSRHRVSHMIVVGQGVSGVRLGDSPKRVIAILGAPRSMQPPYWSYPQAGLRITFENNHVTEVWTESTAMRTSRGIGPGVSRKRLKKTYPKTRCRTARYTSAEACSLFSTIHRRLTESDFLILGSTVRAVEIYFR